MNKYYLINKESVQNIALALKNFTSSTQKKLFKTLITEAVFTADNSVNIEDGIYLFDNFENNVPTRIQVINKKILNGGALRSERTGWHNNMWDIKELILNEGLEKIYNQAIENLKISQIIVPSTVTELGAYWCRGCPIEYIEFKCNVTFGYYWFGSPLKKCICHKDVIRIFPALFPSTMELYDFSRTTTLPPLTASSNFGHNENTVLRIPVVLWWSWQIASNWVAIKNEFIWEVVGDTFEQLQEEITNAFEEFKKPENAEITLPEKTRFYCRKDKKYYILNENHELIEDNTITPIEGSLE